MNVEDLKKRAEVGDSQAQAKLSLAYFYGDGISKDIKIPQLEYS